jgi:hypothetical protein
MGRCQRCKQCLGWGNYLDKFDHRIQRFLLREEVGQLGDDLTHDGVDDWGFCCGLTKLEMGINELLAL